MGEGGGHIVFSADPVVVASSPHSISLLNGHILAKLTQIYIVPASVAQLDARPTGDQEVAGSTPAEVGNILSWRLIMKYFLRSFSPFR